MFLAGRVWIRWMAALLLGLDGPQAAGAADEIAAPVLVQSAEPTYPPAMQDRGLGGTVVVELTVAVDGKPLAASVVQSAGPEFDAAALEATARLQFAPATKGGHPVAVRIRYRFVFAPDTTEQRRAAAKTDGRFDRRDLERNPGGFSSLRGSLREKGTGRPVGGAVVLLDGGPQDALTSGSGEFAFGVLTDGPHVLQLPEGEYRALRLSVQVTGGKTARVDLRAERVHYGLYRATAEAPPRAGEMVRREVAAEEIQRVPGVYGDALKVVQNLPGVARPSPFGGEIVVRGSSPSDSVAMIEGVRIPQAYHFGGLYSVVNTDMLEAIDFLPGGLPVMWGRGTGGVLNARLRTPRDEEPWAGYVETNVFHTGFFLKGRIDDDTRFAVAARRSYIDAVLNAVVPAGTLPFTLAPRYWDYQLKIDRGLGPRTWLTFFGFGSDDRFELVSKQPLGSDVRTTGGIKFGTLFHGAAAILRHEATNWTSKSTLGANYVFQGVQVGTFLRFDATAVDYNLRHEMTYGKGPVQLRGGIDVLHTPIWAHVFAPVGRDSEEGHGQESAQAQSTVNYNGSFSFFGPGLWYDTVIKPRADLEIVPGLRMDLYRGVDSDQTVLPRLAVRWKWNKSLVFKAGSGAYSQRPQPQEVVGFGGLGNPHLKSMRAIDASAGVEWAADGSNTIDLQIFYKSLWNVVVQTPGLFPSPPYINAGLGRVFGLELLARHKLSNRWFGWVAYTLLQADRKDDVAGQWRPFDWDQRHILTAVASYQLPNHWEIGARFRLVTGNPTTPIAASVWEESSGDYKAVDGKYNSARLQPFHQLDLRVDKRIVFDKWMLGLYLDVQNVYNRSNPEGIIYNYDYTQATVQSGLPIIPSLGVRGEF